MSGKNSTETEKRVWTNCTNHVRCCLVKKTIKNIRLTGPNVFYIIIIYLIYAIEFTALVKRETFLETVFLW